MKNSIQIFSLDAILGFAHTAYLTNTVVNVQVSLGFAEEALPLLVCVLGSNCNPPPSLGFATV